MVLVEQRQTYRNPVLHFSSSTCRGVVASARLNRRFGSTNRVLEENRDFIWRGLSIGQRFDTVIGVVFHTAHHLFFRSKEGR